jgi:DNA repair exonuclease SbcCD ATPase subunit
MDTHSEPVSESPAVEQLPDAFEANSFEAALNAAFNNLENGGQQEPANEPVEEVSADAEEPAQTETVVDEDPLEQLTEEVDWTPKAANRFKQLKEELKGSRSELEQLRQLSIEQEAKLQELSAIAENKDIEQLQSRLAEYEQERMFTNLEQTTAYQEAVTKPLASLMEQADQIADKYEIDGNSLIDVLALDDADMQDEKLSELLPNASDRDKARIYRIIEEINPILERRKVLFDNVEEAAKEAALLEETRQKQELAERAQLRHNVTRNVVERITEKLPFVKTIDGIDINAIQTKAASVDPTVIHPVDFAYNAVSAQLLPTIVREYVGLRKEIEALTDKLAEYETAEPSISSGSPAKSGGARSSGSTGGFIDAIDRAFGGL